VKGLFKNIFSGNEKKQKIMNLALSQKRLGVINVSF